METISPYIVDFRSADELPYDHRSVANVDTIYAPNILGRACFFFPWAPSQATQTRQHQCALLTMSSSIFGAEQRISEPLTALAVLPGPD